MKTEFDEAYRKQMENSLAEMKSLNLIDDYNYTELLNTTAEPSLHWRPFREMQSWEMIEMMVHNEAVRLQMDKNADFDETQEKFIEELAKEDGLYFRHVRDPFFEYTDAVLP